MTKLGVKCACGRPVSQERIEEAVSITELGRNLLDGSRWLTLLLLDELLKVGVSIDDILIEQQVGVDEVDCLADISGELVFFELKDKEFSLGNAYSFAAKLGIIRPTHSVILSTQKIGGDARDHFERSQRANKASLGERWMSEQPARIRYIEGLENMRAGVEELARTIYRGDARNALNRALQIATLSAESVLSGIEQNVSNRVSSTKELITPTEAAQ